MFYQKPFKYYSITIALIIFFSTSIAVSGQDRERVIVKKKKTTAQETERPELTNRIILRNPSVKKTSSTKAVKRKAAVSSYLTATTQGLMTNSIRSKMGIRYVYGTQGPRSYDCSGFIWKVFNDSGIPMTRTSAREFWRIYEPVKGNERFQFGTLVFFNRLGHVGIVASKDGFYHASSSKGVTYSKFAGYWSKRIVGYRRIPISEPEWEDFSVVDEDEEVNQ